MSWPRREQSSTDMRVMITSCLDCMLFDLWFLHASFSSQLGMLSIGPDLLCEQVCQHACNGSLQTEQQTLTL